MEGPWVRSVFKTVGQIETRSSITTRHAILSGILSDSRWPPIPVRPADNCWHEQRVWWTCFYCQPRGLQPFRRVSKPLIGLPQPVFFSTPTTWIRCSRMARVAPNVASGLQRARHGAATHPVSLSLGASHWSTSNGCWWWRTSTQIVQRERSNLITQLWPCSLRAVTSSFL